jgi:single-strand DNA-binding protein
MAGNFNKVLLMGRLTRDPKLTYTPKQTAVVEFGVATSRKWTDLSGEQREEVCYINCKAFGKTADLINKYFKKGKPIFVEGRLRFETWTGLAGENRSALRVIVESFQFIPRDTTSTDLTSPVNEEPAPADIDAPCTEL